MRTGTNSNRGYLQRRGAEFIFSGAPPVTAGGLVFCAGTRDLKIRAFDKDTGRELWSYQLPFGGYAPPSVYSVNGREYVSLAVTGGGKLGGEPGDAYVAFTLPESGAHK
jgi:quinoprotein glucose dehydrogenase